MAGGEIEQPCLLREIGPSVQPLVQQISLATDGGFQEQRRQRKVVSQMCFPAAAQIRQIFLLRHIGFAHHDASRHLLLQQQTQHFHHRVGLRSVDAVGKRVPSR